MASGEQLKPDLHWEHGATEMDALLFRQWVELLESRTGIALPESRKSFLLTQLNMRMRELGFSDYHAYFNYVTGGTTGSVEWETLVDRLTVHETRFFRDVNALHVIGQYLQGLPLSTKHSYTVHAWSVGCATGEEPYSLAMVLDDFVKRQPGAVYFGVTASDVSRAALATGRNGVYPQNRVKNVPAAFAGNYLEPRDLNRVAVKERLKRHVCFTHTNLLDLSKATVGQMDIVLCQNVLIYFKQARRQQILNDLITHLKPGGLLVLGAGEVFGWEHPELSLSHERDDVLAFVKHAAKPVAEEQH